MQNAPLGPAAIGAGTKAAAILLFLLFLMSSFFFLKACKLALSTASESLEEPRKIYNKCLKHLGQL